MAGCRICFILLDSVLVWYRNGIEVVATEWMAFMPWEDMLEDIFSVGLAARVSAPYYLCLIYALCILKAMFALVKLTTTFLEYRLRKSQYG